MNDQPNHADAIDPRIDVALQEYFERVDRGEPVEPEAFLAGYPEIADSLRNLIEAEAQLRRLAGDKASLESAGVSTRTFAAPGQETVPPSSQPDGSPGTTGGGLQGRFGRYQIIRALGKGAMGAVYLAHDTQLKRHVAIKTPHFEDDPTGELLKRFYREAEAAATLRHANICPVHDVGQIDGKHFISMAYIEGRPLSDLIRSGKVQSERHIVIAVHKLARALQQAHDHGIVHRDLKPANIMVDKQGEPIIMDFGLARKARKEGEASLTQSGAILGSPAYMSPEQVEGDPGSVRPASDQYSLGVVLYEMLTGQLPFRGSVINVLTQIITKDPTPPSELRPGLDPRIEAVCLRMMSKKASDRFPSMNATATQLAVIVKNPVASPATAEQSPTASRPPAAPALSSGDAATSQIRKSMKPKALTERDVSSLEELVRKCLRRRDYDQMIQLIERIPEDRRNESLQKLLEKAREKVDEIAFLICEIDEAVRLEDRKTALKKAEKLLKIRPGHPRATEIQEKCAGYGDGGVARIAPLSQFTKPWNEGGWIPWSALAFGLAVFAVMTGVIVIYLNKTAIVIDIKDPGVEVAVKGSTLTVSGPDTRSVKVEPGEQELTITAAGFETTTRSFSLKKGDKKTVTVSTVNKEIVARLENDILLLPPAHEGKASDRPNAGKKEVATIHSSEKQTGRRGIPVVESKSNTVATPPKLFHPFLVRGEWRIENDELVQTSLAAGSKFHPIVVFGDQTLSNYDLTLEAEKTDGSGSFGVYFQWLGFGHDRGFYLSNNKWINLSFRYNGKWGREEGNGRVLTHSSEKWYSLKVEVRGDTFRAYLDKVLQFEQTDARFTNGRICIYTWGATARFRRIKVTDPQGKILFEGLPQLTISNEEVAPPKTTPAGTSPVGPFEGHLAGETRTDNGPAIVLVWIPPGEFTMGSPKDEKDRLDNENQVRVKLTKGFWLGQHELTQGEWRRVMQSTPWSGMQHVKEGNDYPATYVSWDDAMKFCEKLTEQERGAGRLPSDWQYSLPTEAQWEFACRAGTTTRFSFGNDDSDLSDYAWWGGIVGNGNAKAEQYAHAIGQKKPNAWKLSDMHGNVWEWCRDWYGKQLPGGTDPLGPSEGSLRAFRGGGWINDARGCRSAHRAGFTADNRRHGLGFRVACDVASAAGATSVKIAEPPGESRSQSHAADYPPPQIFNGDWEIQGDEIAQTNENIATSQIHFGDPGWTDYDFQVQIRRERGRGFFGIGYRSQGKTDRHLFLPSYKENTRSIIDLSEGANHTQPYRQNGALPNDVWHLVQVKVRGNHFEAYLNKTKLFDYHDDRLSHGRVMLTCRYCACRFRDIKVTDPENRILWSGLPQVTQNKASAPPADSALAP